MQSGSTLITAAIAGFLLGTLATASSCQPRTPPQDDALRAYTGTYQWRPDSTVHLQLWSELTGKDQLVAFEESGEVRALYPADHDRFFAGPGAAVQNPVESTIEFQRDSGGRIASLTWKRDGFPTRIARRVDVERRENVQFSNGNVRLAGTLIRPSTGAKHPTIVLVHASGAEDREYLLPFAHFLVRHGMAVLGYDKRGVSGSSGDWRTSSFDDLAGDVVAAVQYLKTRSDVDGTQIGLLGWSQAGWVMPLAAVRSSDIAFLISISGAGIPAAETTIDQTRNGMTASGMRPEVVDQIVALMQLQYRFARTGQGWGEYMAAREKLAARMGRPPGTFPGSQDDPYWGFIRRLYFYDPAATLRRLQVPTLALFGELDDNILAEKNRAAWESALRAGGNSDYTLRILPKANHLMLEARKGNNAEMASLRRFVPAYFTTVRDWLATRIRDFRPQ
jgi:pimeloyl-ACP methyl ester carboxylesterase